MPVRSECVAVRRPRSSVRGGSESEAPLMSSFAGTHPLDPAIRNGTAGPENGGPITIGDDCWFGGNVTVLPHVTIGRGVTVGAGSVVTKVSLGGSPVCLVCFLEHGADSRMRSPYRLSRSWSGTQRALFARSSPNGQTSTLLRIRKSSGRCQLPRRSLFEHSALADCTYGDSPASDACKGRGTGRILQAFSSPLLFLQQAARSIEMEIESKLDRTLTEPQAVLVES